MRADAAGRGVNMEGLGDECGIEVYDVKFLKNQQRILL